MPGSPTRLASAIRRAALVTHGRTETLGDAVDRVEAAAAAASVELLAEEDVDIAVALGGDGTMLRALHRFLGTPVPVIGVNFGRIGFLTSIHATELEAGLARVFAGDYRVVELATISACIDGRQREAVNDVVVTSSEPGRMVELGARLGGEDLGVTACDGLICCTPSGSTAYNLSNGGPVLMRGLDAMAITFVAPHSLHARPLVVEPGLGLEVTNRTPDVAVTVLVDGQRIGELEPAESLTVDVGGQKAQLALLPEVTFFSRYREVFLEQR
jgi:NAD+ kinase